MSKFVVIVHRDRWFRPVLKITVEARFLSTAQASSYITKRVMALYEKRSKRRRSVWTRMTVYDFRIVDEVGLKRLQAAAKASVTLRRRRAAKKAAATRAKRREALRRSIRTLPNEKVPFYGAS